MTDLDGFPEYGSFVYGPIAGSVTDQEILPAGTSCIFDGLLYPGGALQDNEVIKVVARTVGFVPLMGIDVNATSQKSIRKGSVNNADSTLHRSSVASNDGLRIIKGAGSLNGCIVSVMYRVTEP